MQDLVLKDLTSKDKIIESLLTLVNKSSKSSRKSKRLHKKHNQTLEAYSNEELTQDLTSQQQSKDEIIIKQKKEIEDLKAKNNDAMKRISVLTKSLQQQDEMNDALSTWKAQCEGYQQKYSHLKQIVNEELTLDRTTSGDSENQMFRTTVATPRDPLEKFSKYRLICEKIMAVASIYLQGKGKVEKLPATIESVFKKNKLIFDDLNYLCKKVDMDLRVHNIAAVAQEIDRLKSENYQMVRIPVTYSVER